MHLVIFCVLLAVAQTRPAETRPDGYSTPQRERIRTINDHLDFIRLELLRIKNAKGIKDATLRNQTLAVQAERTAALMKEEATLRNALAQAKKSSDVGDYPIRVSVAAAWASSDLKIDRSSAVRYLSEVRQPRILPADVQKFEIARYEKRIDLIGRQRDLMKNIPALQLPSTQPAPVLPKSQ